MDKSFLNSKYLFVLTIFVFLMAFQIADPVDAASTKPYGKVWITAKNGEHYRVCWHVYKVNKYRAVTKSTLFSQSGSYGAAVYMTDIFDKIGKNKIRHRCYMDGALIIDRVKKTKKSSYAYALYYTKGLVKTYKGILS